MDSKKILQVVMVALICGVVGYFYTDNATAQRVGEGLGWICVKEDISAESTIMCQEWVENNPVKWLVALVGLCIGAGVMLLLQLIEKQRGQKGD